MIKTIIFDIGNVLADYNWRAYLDTFPYTPEVKEALGKAMFLSPQWNELDRGVVSYEELIELFIKNAPGYHQEIKHVFKTVGKCIHPFEYAIPWITSLKKAGLNVYVLSNYGEYMFRQTQEALSFLKYVDGGILSYREKVIKPDPVIYKILLERYCIEPNESVFLDDSLANVEAANAIGIHGIHFTSYEKAIKELKALGVASVYSP